MHQINHLNLEQEIGLKNDDIRGAYSPNKQIRFKTAMLRSSLSDYSDAYVLAKGNTRNNNIAETASDPNNRNKKVILKNVYV